ncbi:MAG: bacterial transcriptional activator domain-containing protein [Acetobacteraceae bacterium]
MDVEKILHGGIEALQLVPSPSEGLLTELNAIDPAFDTWLTAQRKRLDRHILSLYSQVLAQVEDPEAMLACAEGFLQRDTMNELGWRERLQAFVTKGKMGKASRTCAEIMDLFNYRLGALPGPETMRLIREIQAHAASESTEFGFSESQNLFKETEVAPREVVPNEAPTIRSKPAPHRHPVVSGNVPRILGRVAVEAFSAPSEVHLTPTAFALAEQLEVELVRLDTLQVIFRPGQKSASSSSPFFQATHQAIDFRVVSIVHLGEPRESSQRGADRNWVTIRLNLPQEEAERNAFSRYIAWSLQWALMIWEGQRALNRPIAELSATRLAARAACLPTHCDSVRSEELNELVRRAEAKNSKISSCFTSRRWSGWCGILRDGIRLKRKSAGRCPTRLIASVPI